MKAVRWVLEEIANMFWLRFEPMERGFVEVVSLRWGTGRAIDLGWGWAVKSAFKANKSRRK